MVERADGLTAETLDRPVEISVDGVDCDPTLRSLLSRLVGQMAMWDAATHERSYDFAVEDHESVGSMRRRLAEVGPRLWAACGPSSTRAGSTRRSLTQRVIHPGSSPTRGWSPTC